MEIICAGISDIGRKRDTNQDAIYINNSNQLYIVADGMGGHSGGELASTMAIKYMSEYYKGTTAETVTPLTKLKNCIRYANEKIRAFADTDNSLEGMGTTVVSFLFDDNKLAIGNVGDSRAYIIKDGEIFQLTRDHSMVQEKLNMGIYNRTQAANDPHKNVLSRTVGHEGDVEIDVFSYQCRPGDIFLICSDGLHGKVSDEDILFFVKKHLHRNSNTFTDVRDAVQMLVRQANENGGQDNISLIIAAVQ